MLLNFADIIYENDEFVLPLSQSELGNWTSSSRESIDRFLSEFANDKIISLEGKKIKIIDKENLNLISQKDDSQKLKLLKS